MRSRIDLLAIVVLILLTRCTALNTREAQSRWAAIYSETIMFDSADDLARGETTSTTPTVHRAEPFRDVIVSWNVHAPDAAHFAVELEVGRSADGSTSPWLYLGGAGPRPGGTVTAYPGGAVDVDVFHSASELDRARVRVRVLASDGSGELEVDRVSICFGGPPTRAPRKDSTPPLAATSLAVPRRSQNAEDPALAPRICSPTSVAMVLAHYGVHLPTATLAERIYDADHDLYGNWPRAVQAAFAAGVPGLVLRFRSFADAAWVVAQGVPLVISIAARPGELTGAPYSETSGHLLVLTGIDERGDAVVNDPAAPSPETVRRTYDGSELARAWLGHGGVAYLFNPPVWPDGP